MSFLSMCILRGTLLVAIAATGVPASAETSVTNVCAVQNAGAAMRQMIPVDLPPLAQVANLSGSALVQFDLNENGVASNAIIVTSSGFPILDAAAQESALGQHYAPQIRACQRVGGTYRILVDFKHDE